MERSIVSPCGSESCQSGRKSTNPPPPQQGQHWNSLECDALVAAYFQMLLNDTRREPYVKSQIIADLQRGALRARSRPSIEYKFRNVSAVLQARGLPVLGGYVPAGNVQRLLAERVSEYVKRRDGRTSV